MDPVTLFGIATASTIVGVSLLMTIKWLYNLIEARRARNRPTPQMVVRQPPTQTSVPAMSL